MPAKENSGCEYHLTKTDIEFLISCACRYNIGRCTYSPHQFIDIVERSIFAMSPQCRRWIIDDINRAGTHLGMDIDAIRWTELKRKLEELNTSE